MLIYWFSAVTAKNYMQIKRIKKIKANIKIMKVYNYLMNIGL